MKIMVVGLGNFGSALAIMLTRAGNEVVGIDRNKHKTESIKDSVNTVITMDITEKAAVEQLPVSEMDVVVISIGENLGDSVIATTLLKDQGAKRICCRAISEIHFSILMNMGVHHIFTPEIDAANNSVSTILYEKVHTAYVISDDYKACEIYVPKRFIGLKVKDLTLSSYGLKLLLFRKAKSELHPQYMVKMIFEDKESGYDDIIMKKDDILVLFGRKKDIDKFTLL